MSNVGFNYGAMGLRNLSALAETEQRRLDMERERSALLNDAQATQVGALIGGVAGGVKGYYNKRKDAHEQRQQDAEDAWRSKATERQNAEMENRIYQRMGYPAQPLPEVPDRPEAKPFDFVADTHQRFVDLGWAD